MRNRKLRIGFENLAYDVRRSISTAADIQSCVRLVLDFAFSRFIGLFSKMERDRVREIQFHDSIRVRYRLNKGDLQAIREIWFQESYRLPFDAPNGVLLDLGANIGMASLWLAKKYPLTRVIAVEPDSNNAALAQQNLELNGIPSQVIEAAVGPQDGIARFASSEHSVTGKLSDAGVSVPMISVASIIKKFEVSTFALVKIDIEGGEQALFDGPIDWLKHVHAIIIEFHPEIVDCRRLRQSVSSLGFQYIAANSFFPDNADCFVKVGKNTSERQMAASL
jgi:FkbM family methyltransferase